MPMTAPTSGSVEMLVVQSSTGRVLGAGQVQMSTSSPALFTQTGTGSGQVSAMNQDGSVNSSSKPAVHG